MPLRETAYAKINLALHVRRRRSDGYHDLETVFAFCQDGDVVEAWRSAFTTLSIDGPFAHGLSTDDNLVVRACEAAGVRAAVQLTKNVPVASGIGGGSADAAATLRLLSRLSGEPLPSIDVQLRLGADVPACVISQTMRGEGVGETLTPLPPLTGTPVLLVNPRIALSTAAVFAAWDGIDRGPLERWEDGRNDLEPTARAIVPEIGTVLDWLSRRRGATIGRMSGSGATCFALFEAIEERDAAARSATRDRPDWWTLSSQLR